jgi:hypothetical protein
MPQAARRYTVDEVLAFPSDGVAQIVASMVAIVVVATR